MSFSNNLKQIRKEKGLSQENLAELLDVSRQAVSKWEMGDGYPEVEKLLLLSQKLDISLDELLETGHYCSDNCSHDSISEISITSPNENVIIKCMKVASSQEYKTGKNSPKYALFGVSGASMLGENTTFLGWYANKESITMEIAGIQDTMRNGIPSYELKYSVKTQNHWGRIKIIE